MITPDQREPQAPLQPEAGHNFITNHLGIGVRGMLLVGLATAAAAIPNRTASADAETFSNTPTLTQDLGRTATVFEADLGVTASADSSEAEAAASKGAGSSGSSRGKKVYFSKYGTKALLKGPMDVEDQLATSGKPVEVDYTVVSSSTKNLGKVAFKLDSGAGKKSWYENLKAKRKKEEHVSLKFYPISASGKKQADKNHVTVYNQIPIAATKKKVVKKGKKPVKQPILDEVYYVKIYTPPKQS